MATLEDLEMRVAELERQVAGLRAPDPDGLAERAARGARQAKAMMDTLFAELGVAPRPVGAETIQDMIRARCGDTQPGPTSAEMIREMREE